MIEIQFARKDHCDHPRWHRYNDTSTSQDTLLLIKEMSQAKDVLAEIQALKMELERKNGEHLLSLAPSPSSGLDMCHIWAIAIEKLSKS